MKAAKSFFISILMLSTVLVLDVKVEGEERTSSQAILNSAESLILKGKYSEAFDYLQTALMRATLTKDKYLEINCFYLLGEAFWNMGKMEDSKSAYEKARTLAKFHGLSKMEGNAMDALEIHRLYSEGKRFRESKKYDQSIESFEKAITLARRRNSLHLELKCLRQESIAYLERNDLNKFYVLNVAGSQLAHKINNKREICACNNNIGLYHYKISSYSKSLKCFYYSYDIAQKELFEDIKMEVLSNITTIFIEMGKYDDALKCQKYIIQQDQINKNTESLIIDFNNMGVTYRKRGDYLKNSEDLHDSLDSYNEALMLIWKTKSTQMESYVLNNIGNVLFSLKQYPMAIKRYRAALAGANKRNDDEEICNIQNNIGNALLEQGLDIEALTYFKKAKEFAESNKCNKYLWEAYSGLAKCSEAKKNYTEAIEYYYRSMEIFEKLRRAIAGDISKVGFTREKKNIYDGLIRSIRCLNKNEKDDGFNEEIFRSIEKQKAQIFMEFLEDREKRSKSGAKNEDDQELIRINQRMAILQKQKTRQYLTKDEFNKLESELVNEEEKYMGLVGNRKDEMQTIEKNVYDGMISIKELTENILDERTAILEYHLGEGESQLLVIMKRTRFMRILKSKEMIENAVKGYIKYLGMIPEGDYDKYKAGLNVYQELMPTRETLKQYGIENIIIIPDGILHYLPFETLIDETAGLRSRFLIEKYRISYSPSCAALYYLTVKSKNKGMGFLGFGDPRSPKTDKIYGINKMGSESPFMTGYEDDQVKSSIPYSREEIQSASKYYSKKNRSIHIGEDAGEDIIKKCNGQDYEIIHLACHGILDEQIPIRSAIVLAKSSEEDGYFQLREVYNIQLGAELVILSACQTARGIIEDTEGVMGLPRVFFYSGARSVLSTLWSVMDRSTMIFMKYFYKHLSRGESKAVALKSAKMEMLKTKYAHPYYWAGFILQGEPNSKIHFH